MVSYFCHLGVGNAGRITFSRLCRLTRQSRGTLRGEAARAPHFCVISLQKTMGFLKDLFRSKEKVHVDGRGGYDLEVVGESNYQKHLKRICGGYSKEGHRKTVTAELHYEDDNPYDKKAVRVDVANGTVGYLSREDARLYRKRVKKTGREDIIITCNAVIVGGKKTGLFSRTYFGVWIDLPLEEL